MAVISIFQVAGAKVGLVAYHTELAYIYISIYLGTTMYNVYRIDTM